MWLHPRISSCFIFFAGKRLRRELPRMLQLMLQVLLFIQRGKYYTKYYTIYYIFLIYDICRSEHVLEASGITVAPPECPCSTSHIPPPSVLSTKHQTKCQRCPPPKSKSSSNKDKDNNEDNEDNEDDEDNNDEDDNDEDDNDEDDNDEDNGDNGDKDEDENDDGDEDNDKANNKEGNTERIIPAPTTLALSTSTPAKGMFNYFDKYNSYKIKFRF